jgi:hypothetical protein
MVQHIYQEEKDLTGMEADNKGNPGSLEQECGIVLKRGSKRESEK